MVITAHTPHPKGKKTWFGYWREDGFIKTKHQGRFDGHNRWSEIRDKWVNAFRNREIIEGLSTMQEVGHTDEWCAEAYLATDYDVVTPFALKRSGKHFLILNAMIQHASREQESGDEEK